MFSKNKVDVPLKGVEGWLAFLVIRYMVLTPVLLIARIQNEFAVAEQLSPQLLEVAGWVKYKSIMWSGIWVFIAVALYAGYGLWKVHAKKSVVTAIIAEWFLCLGLYAGAFLALHLSFGEIQLLDADSFSTFFGSAIVSVVWTAYLLRSKRVKNTYQ